MENTFDSAYIINKAKYDEFVAEASKLAIAVYTIRFLCGWSYIKI